MQERSSQLVKRMKGKMTFLSRNVACELGDASVSPERKRVPRGQKPVSQGEPMSHG